MRMIKKLPGAAVLCFCLMLSSLLFFACGGSDDGYLLYFIGSDGISMESESYKGEIRDGTADMAAALLSALSEPPKDKGELRVIPEDTEVTKVTFDDEAQLLSVYFSEAYSNVSGSAESLARGAIVKTLLQVDGVQNILFYVGSSPLVDVTGRTVGTMTKDSFIGDFGKNQAELQSTKLILYYAASDGERLIPFSRTVHYSSNTNLAELVVENLCIPPVSTSAKAVYSDSSKILHASISGGICYLDIDSSFYSQITDVTQEVAVYSLVNSLCELPGVSKVQITVYVNGKPDTGEGSRSGTYVKNTDLIIQ